MKREHMVDSSGNIISQIDTQRSLLKHLVKKSNDRTIEHYLYLLPRGVRQPGLEGALQSERRIDWALPRLHAVHDTRLNTAQEIGDYSEFFDDSIEMRGPPPAKESKLSEVSDPSPWFTNHARQYQAWHNERDIEVWREVKGFRLHRSYYASLSVFLKDFSRQLSTIIRGNPEAPSVKYYYDDANQSLEITLAHGLNPIEIVCDSPYLSTILGIDWVLELQSKANPQEKSYVYRFPCSSVRPPRLDFVQSFIVYSDVGDYIQTGGILTPHLARFPVTAAPGAQVSYVANPPCYVPVTRTHIDSILLQLYDPYGEPPPFSTRHECIVSVKLHFRLRKV
jgi:hypothetical protein